MPKVHSWEVADSFWEKVKPLIPTPERDSDRVYKRKAGGGRKPLDKRKVFEGIVYCVARWLPVESGSQGAVWLPQRHS